MYKKSIIRRITQKAALVIISILCLLSNIIALPVEHQGQLIVPVSSTASSDSDYRCYLEYSLNNGSSFDKTAGILRQTIIYVYAFQGETICVGSDIYDSHISVDEKYQNDETGADIVVVYPDSSVHPLDTVLNGVGYIGNTVQESNPPDYKGNKDNTQYYIPHMLTAPEDGIYEIRFHSYSGNRGKTAEGTHRHTSINPLQITKDDDGWVNSAATVGAWNITVVDKREQDEENQIKNGRAYTKCLCLNAGSNNVDITETYYVVTHDGYIYRTEFERLDPFGFVFFSNSRGLIDNDTSCSAYHSYNTGEADLGHLMNDQEVSFQNPSNKDTDVDKTFRVFFEEPDPALEEVIYPKAYVPDDITDIEFIGAKHDNITYVDDGGYFKFSVSRSTSATLVINFDNYNEAEQTSFAPVSITQNAFAGVNYFYWDGRDGNGVVIPEGVYESGITISVTNHAGEYHFPLFDVENSDGRVSVERINEIYELAVDDDGIVYNRNVTDQFDYQKYNVYYNNKIVPDGRILVRNELITDPAEIAYMQKYCYKFGTAQASDYINYKTDGGINAYQSYHVRVFNREATMENMVLSEEEADELYARLCEGSDEDAWFDYYLIIADQLDCSHGIDSSLSEVLHFPAVTERVNSTNYSYRCGDITAIDIWTYSLGNPVETVLRRGIIVEDIKGYRHSNVRGRVFFDTDNNGVYSLHDGDYGISGVDVEANYTYTEIRWEEEHDDETGELISLSCITADGKENKLYPTEMDGIFDRFIVTDDGEEYAGEIGVRKEELPHLEGEEAEIRYYADIPVTLRTRTDANGTYNFTGILMLEVSEGEEIPGDLTINVTKPSAFYNITTEPYNSGDFDYLTGTEKQTVHLADIYSGNDPNVPSPTFDVADVGYFYEEYEPPIILRKEWEQEITEDPDRPQQIIFRVVGTTRDEPNSYKFDQEFTMYYYEESWQKTLSHLPRYCNGEQLSYKVLYEKFEKGGTTYYFDGVNYYSDYESKVPVTPPYYSSMTENKTYTGHILTVVNGELLRTIEITKLADNDRRSAVAGAVFKAEWYNPDTEGWELISGNLVTNQHGKLMLRDKASSIPSGKYRFTEIRSPRGFTEIGSFEIELADDVSVYRKTVYEPPENVSLTLTKTFTKSGSIIAAFPDQELKFAVELALDADFTEIIQSDVQTLVPQQKVDSYTIFDSISIPNSAVDRDIYVRITEMNAGSYDTSAAVTAESVKLGKYGYSTSEYKFDVSKPENKVLTFKLKPPAIDGIYTKYDIQLKNTAKIADTIRFKKAWFNSAMENKTPADVKAVYGKLMRMDLATGEKEQVTRSIGGSSNSAGSYISIGTSGGYSGVNDKAYTDQGYFALSMTKNFTTGTYWLLPSRAPDGGKYLYYVEEVTNERGNPLCVVSGNNTPQYLYDYKVIPLSEYTEYFTLDGNKITSINVKWKGTEILKKQKPHDSILNTAQSNYFILNRFTPDLALRIVKTNFVDPENQEEELLYLAGAEFTLYSDTGCKSALGTMVTGEEGTGEFSVPIEEGKTYYLRETKAPEGYVLDSRVIKIEYLGSKQVTVTETAADGTETVITLTADSRNTVELSRTNVKNSEVEIPLISTGSDITPRTLAVTGASIMGTAMLALCIIRIRSKRKTEI